MPSTSRIFSNRIYLELLEDAVEEMSEDLALPIAIVLIVGFLGNISLEFSHQCDIVFEYFFKYFFQVILCMAIVTWYCVTRDSTVTVVTVLFQLFSAKPTQSIVGGEKIFEPIERHSIIQKQQLNKTNWSSYQILQQATPYFNRLSMTHKYTS